MSEVSQGAGWWRASDGKWYPPNADDAPLRPPVGGAGPWDGPYRPSTVPDPWLPHFLRFVCVYTAIVGSTALFLLGFIWVAIILSQTGRRRRDLLFLLIPFLGAVVMVTTVWRYTARDVYWTPRTDRPSKVLSGTARPVIIAVGAVLFVVYIGAIVFTTATAESSWSPEYRRGFTEQLEVNGFTSFEAECIAEKTEMFYEGRELSGDEDDIDSTIRMARAICGVPEE